MTRSSPQTSPWDDLVATGVTAVVLVRHGQTAWNAERRFLGATDLPLDPVGERQVAALGERIGGTFDAVYTSPLLRARQTARVLAPPEAIPVDGLRELGHGALEGLDGEAGVREFPEFFAAFAADPTDARVSGGETFREVRDRALAALRAIAAGHAPGARIAVVAHQVVVSTALCTLAGEPLSAWRRFSIPNAGAAVLAWSEGEVRIVAGSWPP